MLPSRAYFAFFLQVKILLQEDDHRVTADIRSIGIISLWHEPQARMIDKLLEDDEYISARREKHKIRCGTAREFQGDEKDIILLSLVIGPTEKRQASKDEAGFNVAMSRARYSCILFHSVTAAHLKEEDVRKQLLKYFQQYDASTGAKQTVSGAFKDLQHLIKLINRLEGYTVTFNEIRGQALMLQIGSKCCEKSCTFVFLGVFDDWEKEQEICYMLSRLGRTWKGFWIFDAIVRPDHCLKEIKNFLRQQGVVGDQIQPSSSKKRKEDEERRRKEEERQTHVAAGDVAVTCVRERLGRGLGKGIIIEGAREARAQAALEYEEAKENRDAELAVGIRDLLNTSATLLLSQCFSWCYDIL